MTMISNDSPNRRIVLRAEDVWKGYDDGAINVLRGVSFTGFEGDTVALWRAFGMRKEHLTASARWPG